MGLSESRSVGPIPEDDLERGDQLFVDGCDGWQFVLYVLNVKVVVEE